MAASENPSSSEGSNMREKWFFFFSLKCFCLHTFTVINNLKYELIPAYASLLTERTA